MVYRPAAFKGWGVELEVEGVRYIEMHRGPEKYIHTYIIIHTYTYVRTSLVPQTPNVRTRYADIGLGLVSGNIVYNELF